MHDLTRGRAPRWLHEGLAQALDGTPADPLLRVPGRPTLTGLEEMLGDPDPVRARAGYDIALWVVHDLLDRGGMPAMRSFMARLGRGDAIASGGARRLRRCRSPSSNTSGAACWVGDPADVSQDPDRQPGRDRAADHPHVPGARHPHRDRAFDRRRALAARAGGRRVDLRGAQRRARQLSQHRRNHLRRRAHRQRGDPSRLRLPRRESVLRRHLPRLRAHLHRPLAGGDPPHGRQGPGPRHRQAGRGAGGAGQRGAAQGRGRGDRGRRRGRLSGDPEGGGRWRRARHAHRPQPDRGGPGLRRLPGRGRRGLRLLGDLLREVHRGGAARRGAGARRQERHARAPG